jgi:AraC-like DNA-binding protein
MSDLKELIKTIAQYAEDDGVYDTAVPRVSIVRISSPSEPVHGVHKAAICIVAQGTKQVVVADQTFRYEGSQQLLVSCDLPVIGQVVGASKDEPYLSMKLELDPELCTDLLVRMPPAPAETDFSLAISSAQPDLLSAMLRLLKLHETPEDIAELAPLIEREVLYRLLKSEQGGFIRRMFEPQHRHRHVGRAISWIQENYARPFTIEEVASLSGMSPSSLHQHFRDATAMSPLQYQKQLRLQEARRLILTRSLDAATAGHSVGYESPSQFSREYKRLFGAPPQRDIERLRHQPQGYADA